jgi:tetratricopeptide (TPR) repeat protein
MSGLREGACALAVLLLASGFAGPLAGQSVVVDVSDLGLAEDSRERLEAAISAGQWERAEEWLFEASQQESPSAALLRALGAAHLKNRRFLQAATAYLRAERLKPLDAGSRFALAQAYLGLEKRHWARRELERLATDDPRDPLYPYWLAGIYFDYQWFELSSEQARRAIELDPESAAAQDRLGQALEGMNRLDEALERYEIATEKAARSVPNAAATYHLGRLLGELGRLEDSAGWLEKARRIDPNLAEAQYELGRALQKLGRWAESVSALERAAQLRPLDAATHYALFRAHQRLGHPAAAQAALGRFQALSAE